MAAFIQDLQATFDATVRAVRSSDPVASLFQTDGKAASHFKPSDANYIIGDFIGVVGVGVDFALVLRVRSCTMRAGFTFAVPMLLVVLQRFLFEPIAKRVLGARGLQQGARLPDKQRAKVRKFCEACWKWTMYTTLHAMTWRAVIGEPWLRDTSYFWKGWPNHVPSVPLRQVYCAELGFNIASAFVLAAWETRRKDFWVMMLHHGVTTVLISLSYYLKFFRVGSMVLLCHDISDIMMEAAKLCKYAGLETASTALFVGFMVTWLLARLTYYPFWIIRSTLFEAQSILGPIPFYRLFNGLLITLLIMHIYWFALIVRIAWRVVTKGNVDDVRESDSDED